MNKSTHTSLLLQKRPASALLVAILVMGILLTLTLGLSTLIVREIRQTGDVVAAGKAYFAAEAGVEQALYDLSQGLPGYETLNSPDAQEGWIAYPAQGDDDEFLNYQYRIDNKADSVPYFPDDQPIFLSPDIAPQGAVTKDYLYDSLPDETYNVLGLNQTVTVPLFTDNGDGTFTDVTSFMVQYYVDFDVDPDAPDFQGKQIVLENFDILRWKLFGNPKCEGGSSCPESNKTDAISDFYPSSSTDTASFPVCIGSELISGYNCQIPVAPGVDYAEEGGPTGSVSEGAFAGSSWSLARECYIGDAGAIVAPGLVQKGCLISTFVNNHQRNYITLTNVVNPDIVGVSNPQIRNAKANIYYRIVASKGDNAPKLVREFADISADGFAKDGEIKQSISTKIRLSSFLPVFNFSLYRTDTGSTLDSPDGGDVDDNNVFGGLGGFGPLLGI